MELTSTKDSCTTLYIPWLYNLIQIIPKQAYNKQAWFIGQHGLIFKNKIKKKNQQLLEPCFDDIFILGFFYHSNPK